MTFRHDWPEDIDRICDIAWRKVGKDLSRREAADWWEKVSEAVCASWLILPSDEQLEKMLRVGLLEAVGVWCSDGTVS